MLNDLETRAREIAEIVANRCHGSRKPNQAPERFATVYQAARFGALEALTTPAVAPDVVALVEHLQMQTGYDLEKTSSRAATALTTLAADRDRLYTLAKANNTLARMNGNALDTAKAEVAMLREALEPFAKVAFDIITNRDDDEALADTLAADRLTWGHLRRARTALARTAAPMDEEDRDNA